MSDFLFSFNGSFYTVYADSDEGRSLMAEMGYPEDEVVYLDRYGLMSWQSGLEDAELTFSFAGPVR